MPKVLIGFKIITTYNLVIKSQNYSHTCSKAKRFQKWRVSKIKNITFTHRKKIDNINQK